MTVKTLIGLVFTAFMTVACTTSSQSPSTGYDYGVEAFKIRGRMENQILERHLETINALRLSQGLAALEYSDALTAAALKHAADIKVQARAWHFGSDGTSPIERIANAGFPGQLVGENLSETYEDDQVTLQAWLRDPNSRSVILDPNARYIGFAWFQEPNWKLWWVQVIGDGSNTNVNQGF
ncbi:MAG: CAP domain-containing protein [Pseudomonadota bacterium]